jgi:hypothetical protein
MFITSQQTQPITLFTTPQYRHHVNLYVVQTNVNIAWGNKAYLNVKCFSSTDLEAVFSVVRLQSKHTGSHDGQQCWNIAKQLITVL